MFLSILRSRISTLVISCVVLQACLATPGSQISGKYCLEGAESSCLYLQPGGQATMTTFGVLVDARWEFLEKNRIKIVADSTSTGLILDVSPGQSELVGLVGLLRYVRTDSVRPGSQPLPADGQRLPLSPQGPQQPSGPQTSQAAPLVAVIAFLLTLSLSVGLILLIRRRGADDF